jgi:hypothetical protein
MNAARLLEGFVINLSVSESDDSAKRGFPLWQINRLTLQIVSALFGQGAGIVFGHEWRDDGVMEAVHGFARQMQSPALVAEEDAQVVNKPLLQNVLPWPDHTILSDEDQDRLSSTLRIEQAGLPPELVAIERSAQDVGTNSDLFHYVRARGLTHLRHKLDSFCHGRFCIGGRTSGSQGRYPGIIEEALLALESRKPLYLAGLLGGATAQLIGAIQGQEMPESFCRSAQINAIYEHPPVAEFDLTTLADRQIDRTALWNAFRNVNSASLAENNGLTTIENNELFETPVLDRVINLVLKGASRLKHRTQ